MANRTYLQLIKLNTRSSLTFKTQYQEHLSYLEEQLKSKQVDEVIDNAGFCPDPICRAKIHSYETSITKLKKELQQLQGEEFNL